MEAEPSWTGAGMRGGVESAGAAVEGGKVGQFGGLGSRFMWEDVKGAAVAGATAVDMTQESREWRSGGGWSGRLFGRWELK